MRRVLFVGFARPGRVYASATQTDWCAGECREVEDAEASELLHGFPGCGPDGGPAFVEPPSTPPVVEKPKRKATPRKRKRSASAGG